MQRGTPEPRDNVDRVFARLQSINPPPDLTQRIMRSLPATLPVATAAQAKPVVSPRVSARQWQWVATGAGIILLLMSIHLGTLLDDSGALSVLGVIFGGFGDFLSAPGDYLSPLAAELPWFDIILAVLALIVFWVSSSASVDRSHGKQSSSAQRKQ